MKSGVGMKQSYQIWLGIETFGMVEIDKQFSTPSEAEDYRKRLLKAIAEQKGGKDGD